MTANALKLVPLVFVRWRVARRGMDRVDLDAAEWRIPAARMKMHEPAHRAAV